MSDTRTELFPAPMVPMTLVNFEISLDKLELKANLHVRDQDIFLLC